MAAHIPHERCLVLFDKHIFRVVKNAAAYHLVRVMPSTTDVGPLIRLDFIYTTKLIQFNSLQNIVKAILLSD